MILPEVRLDRRDDAQGGAKQDRVSVIIIQRHSDGLHFRFTGKASRSRAHDLGARQLGELRVEDPDGVYVSTCKQRLNRPAKPDARLQVI